MPNDARKGWPLRDLTPGLKGLLTAVLLLLALRYALAVQQVFDAYMPAAVAPVVTTEAPAQTHPGAVRRNRLEAALLGTMSNNAPAKERQVIIKWSVGGADRASFESTIKPIVDKRCMRCHAMSQWGAPLFGSYENFVEFTKPLAPAMPPLPSPIHLIGMAFLFGVLGLVFARAQIRPRWLKPLLIALPYPVILAQMGVVYLTGPATNAGWFIIASSAVLGLAFAVPWMATLAQLHTPRL